MKRCLLVAVVLAASFVPSCLIGAQADSVTSLIADRSAAYGLSVSCMEGLAYRESTDNPGAVNSSSGASGLYQFLRHGGVWSLSPQAAAGDDPSDLYANVEAASYLQSAGYGAIGWGVDCR